jgi:hypothetical protein
MIPVKKFASGKTKGYEREYDKKGNPIYTTGEMNVLDNDRLGKEICKTPFDENSRSYDFREEV